MSNFSGSNDLTLPSQTPPPPTPPARLGTWLLLSLVIGYFLSIWFIVIDPGDGNGNAGALGTIGYLLFFIVFITVLVRDFRGFVSLNGAIHWRTLSGGKRFWLVLLFVFFFEILLGVYLVRAVVGYYQLTQRRPSDHLQAARSWYVTRSRGVQAGLAAGTLVALITFCSVSGIALGQRGANSGNSGGSNQTLTAATNTPNSSIVVQQATDVPTATATATATATNTPKPAPQPTNTPAPACNTGGAPPNPWCYTFANTGKLIRNPPSNFCDYFNCIASFWTSTNGYVDECNDGTYSHSGGVQGACSRHGGELRPLYAP